MRFYLSIICAIALALPVSKAHGQAVPDLDENADVDGEDAEDDATEPEPEADADGPEAEAEVDANPDAPSEDPDWAEPTEADVAPVDLTEVPFIPEETEEPPDLGRDSRRSWAPDASLSVGVFVTELTTPGIFVGATHRLEEQGPQTIVPHVIGGRLWERRIWADVQLQFGIDPGNGLAEIDTRIGVHGRRSELIANDGSERAWIDMVFGPVSIDRDRQIDNELSVLVAIFESQTVRMLRVRDRVEVGLNLRVGTAGYKHIEYAIAPDTAFDGVRLLALGADVVPTFQVGAQTSVRYILGADADIAFGSRHGDLVSPRFTVNSLLSGHTGAGVDIGEHLSWDARLGFRGVVDSRRDNQSGWRVWFGVTGRY